MSDALALYIQKMLAALVIHAEYSNYGQDLLELLLDEGKVASLKAKSNQTIIYHK